MKKLKHSKYKNTGFLFELLTRQITVDIINGNNSIAESLVGKYFGTNTELGKELRLYQIILKEKSKSEAKANRVIEAIIGTRKRLSESKLKKEKYSLIKEIKDKFDIDAFFKSTVPNYKLYASIYKFFENAVSEELYRPIDVLNANNTIVEFITGSPVASTNNQELVDVFRKQDTDVRLISYKILVESFNKKYKNLSVDQKKLLREYINNLSNTNSLREYINNEVVPTLKWKLNLFDKKIEDDVTRIKLSETIKQLDRVTTGSIVKDNQIVALMMTYELIKELKNVTK